jgi:threonine aldolase
MPDLRSDTVTKPTESMRRAMLDASLGDDVYGEDPTVNALEAEAAEFLGKEASVFVPSGTMANTIAIAVSTRPGDEMILLEDGHVYLYEAGGSARLWGVHARPLAGPNGCLEPSAIEAAIRPDDPHDPVSRLVCLENTHNMQGGLAVAPARLAAVATVCRKHRLHLHLDGARIANAAAALGVPTAAVAAAADTVSLCFSKGLSCPVGSVVAGSASAMKEARRVRKLLGGGMRQAGVIAACARVALREEVPRLAEDHARARRLAAGLRELPGARLDPDPPQTNILFVRFEGLSDPGHDQLAAALAKEGVLTLAIAPRGLRLVTHRDVGDGDIDRTLAVFRKLRR